MQERWRQAGSDVALSGWVNCNVLRCCGNPRNLEMSRPRRVRIEMYVESGAAGLAHFARLHTQRKGKGDAKVGKVMMTSVQKSICHGPRIYHSSSDSVNRRPRNGISRAFSEAHAEGEEDT